MTGSSTHKGSGRPFFRMAETDPARWRDTVLENISGNNASFFLESGLVDPLMGRYSYAGTGLHKALISKGNSVIALDGTNRSVLRENPFTVLRNVLASIDPSPEGLPFPFAGGVVGYFGYELNSCIEDVPIAGTDEVAMPDMFLGCFRDLWLFDHIDNRAYSVSHNNCDVIPEVPEIASPDRNELPPDELESNFTREGYVRAVKRAKEYIAAGDIFQVNLSQRFKTRLNLDPLDLFLTLQRTNPAPYSAFLRLGDASVISSSPELCLKVRGRHVITRPIKGTRRRGRTPGEDGRLADELLKSPKDAAELAMIVDLERNDLGKVCRYGTVRVTQPKILESYASVHHLVATVEGHLKPECDSTDLLLATLPGGSITGAPKIRAMEIIAELEPTTRSVYTGCIGCLDPGGDMDLNIAIRTIITRKDCAYFNVGGGIVADSDPESEYEETLYKGEKLAEVLKGQAYKRAQRSTRRDVPPAARTA